jgi:hypothetical protein
MMDVEVVPPGTVQRFELKQRRWKDERRLQLVAAPVAAAQAAADNLA